MTDCQVAGVECNAGTARFLHCHFEHQHPKPAPHGRHQIPRPPSAALVLASGSPVVSGCTFIGPAPHVVCAQQDRGDGRTQVIAARPFSNALLLQNWFFDESGAAVHQPVATRELPDGAAPRSLFVQPVTASPALPRGGADATRGPRGLVLDQSLPDGPVESTWSTQNLLQGTLFDKLTENREEADWQLEASGFQRHPPWKISVAESGEAAHVGPVVLGELEGVKPEPRPLGRPSVIIAQRLVVPWTDAQGEAAWSRRNWTRGRRLVGAVWAKSTERGSVQVGFRETSANPRISARYHWGRPIASVGEWDLVTAYVDPRSVEYPLQATVNSDNLHQSHGHWGIDFVIRMSSAGTDDVQAAVGAPQVTWGPDLIPVGPPRIATAQSRFGWNGQVGAITFARGFTHEEQVELRAGQQDAEGVLGVTGLIESIEFSSVGDGGPGEFEVHLVPLGKPIVQLTTVRVTSTKLIQVEHAKPPPWDCPGVSRLVVKRTGGARSVPLTAVAVLRHSRTV